MLCERIKGWRRRAGRWATGLAVVLLAAAGGPSALADTINVPDQYPTIQAGIDAANDGDEVVVAPRFPYYSGPGNWDLDFNGKSITVRTDGASIDLWGDPDVAHRAFHFHSGETSDARVEGFTIWGDDDPPPLIDMGGAILIDGSSPTIFNCTFKYSYAQLGGAIYCANGSAPAVVGCYFDECSAQTAGGMYNSASSPLLVNCVFDQNGNGGVYNESSNPTIINCSFVHNSDDNDGRAIYNQSSSPTVVNSIVWGSNDAYEEIYDDPGSSTTVSYSCVRGGWSGPGSNNINSLPRFLQPFGPFDLGHDSPCVDAGDNAAVPVEILVDITGKPRVFRGDVDMGAYEFAVNNMTKAVGYGTLAAAIDDAYEDDQLISVPDLFTMELEIDMEETPLTLTSTGEISQPDAGWMFMGDEVDLVAAWGYDLTLAGALEIGVGSRVMLEGEVISVAETGTVDIWPYATVDLSTDTATINQGLLSVYDADVVMQMLDNIGETVFYGGSFAGMDLSNTGLLTVYGVSFLMLGEMSNAPGATVTGYGDLFHNVTNDGDAIFLADTQVVGDYVNNGTTTVQNGTLTIIGTLTNNGTIIGDVAGGGAAQALPAAAGDGLAVLGDLTLGAGASLLMSSADLTVRTSRDFDAAINDNASFDLAQAELRTVGLGDVAQSLEIMSKDIGPDPAGLDRTLPGHYPLGILRIGPTPTIVSMVDLHDNDGLGQGLCEAIYVANLIIDGGATLNTNGCSVYYTTAQVDGAVDDPSNLIQITSPCPWDLNGDGTVGISDLLGLLSAWGTDPGGPPDFDADGFVGIGDLLTLLANWGPCP
ncbi:MAG: right-handed parallel beta-helix repeat-containing protein [Planctomycetota bacterium]|jgi:hypothetical protein